MPGSSIYTERILNKRVFRLLFILPATDRHKQLECYCLPFDIDDAPAYEALSYVWGKSTSSTQIRCNGQSVAIGLELSYALTKLRLPDATRIIWADALCINQDDKPEKSHQVPLMGSIYSLAKRVVVWLGEGQEEHISEAFTCSKYIAGACLRYDEERGLHPNHEEGYNSLNLPREIFLSSTWESLQKLYERPWFSRVWCVQEIRLAQDAFVIWGDYTIPWLHLSLAASWIFHKSIDEETAEFEVPFAVGQCVLHAYILRGKGRYPLLGALNAFCDFKSTNPRDKVYGLLNLVENQAEIEALGLDYEKSVGEVYADTVLAVIRVHSRLSALAYVTHRPEYDPDDGENGNFQYRSWGPRWNDRALTSELGLSEHDCRWKPYGDNETVVMDDHDAHPEELCLKGVFYNRVCEVGKIMDYHDLQDPVVNGVDLMRPEDDVIDLDSQSVGSNPVLDIFDRVFVESSSEAIHRAWARTLTAGCWDENDDYIENLDPAIRESYYLAYYRFMRRLKELQVTGTEGEFAHDENSVKFDRTVYRHCQQRRVFWTENMSFGLGPQCMEANDVVVVLYGGNTPYVLRPKGDKYLFMGQAYVDDIMHGEMFSGSEKYEERTFCLI